MPAGGGPGYEQGYANKIMTGYDVGYNYVVQRSPAKSKETQPAHHGGATAAQGWVIKVVVIKG